MRTDELANLVARKRDVLSHLRALAVRQFELAEGSDWSELEKVLSAKERLLALVVQLEAQLDPFRADNPDDRVWESCEARQACREQSRECAALLAEIMRLERQSEEAMVRRRDAAAARLAGLQAGGAAHAAYLADGPTSLGFDLVSES
jgi:hypothetical protein